MVLSSAVLLSVIFWNADFYAARDRWEHFKKALLGEWQGQHHCPSWIKNRYCDEVHAFEAAFATVDDFTFFKFESIEDSELDVITGISFATAQDVLNAKPQWQACYLAFGTGTVTRRLNLAKRVGREAVVYFSLNDVSPEDLATIKLSVDQLQALVRTHCRFDVVGTPVNDPSESGKNP